MTESGTPTGSRTPVTRTDLEAGVGADWESLVLDGIDARQRGDAAAWELGDLACQVQTAYGKRTLENYAGAVGVNFSALQWYSRVAARFEKLTRVSFSSLTWSHFRLVAPKRVLDPESWLEKAQRYGWSVAQLEAALEDALGAETPELPPGVFRVVYADPPWSYDNTGFDTSAEAHYPTMALEAICALEVEERAADDAVLFLWVTNPFLAEGLRVCEAWGFDYKTNLVWVKANTVAGFYARGQHELLYVATRGSCLPKKTFPSVITAERREHSRKPDIVYDIVEAMYDGPYIELFARGERAGWEPWGNEIESGTRIPACS